MIIIIALVVDSEHTMPRREINEFPCFKEFREEVVMIFIIVLVDVVVTVTV
jgi:hypothetical protein